MQKTGGKMQELFNTTKTKEEINQMSPLTWAYVGDAVYELIIRTHLTNTTNLKPHKLHITSIKYVKAKAQAEILKKLEMVLTDEEQEIVRRGRNTQTNHTAKNASMQDYMYSTAFEALIGYLYLTKQEERLKQIIDESMKNML